MPGAVPTRLGRSPAGSRQVANLPESPTHASESQPSIALDHPVDPNRLRPDAVLQLQKVAGNRATMALVNGAAQDAQVPIPVQRRIEKDTKAGTLVAKGEEQFVVVGPPDPGADSVLKVQSKKDGRFWNLTERALELYDVVAAGPPSAAAPTEEASSAPPPEAPALEQPAPPPTAPEMSPPKQAAPAATPAKPGPVKAAAAKPKTVPAPNFGKAFASTSIGVESELSGFICALPKNEKRTFAFVKLAATNEPLVQVTKDMSTGSYKHPTNPELTKTGDWLSHTVELVSYPGQFNKAADNANRSDAVQFLLELFKTRLGSHNHKPLETTTSQDGRFKLEISNTRHVIAAGTGLLADESPSVGMGRSGQQATMGVKAKDFGTGGSDELKMLEAAPWYDKSLIQEGALALAAKNVTTPAAANVYAYLKSVIVFTAKLVAEYHIGIGTYNPPDPKAMGLTDPKVKNAWGILPRTAPVRMLDTLQGAEKQAVRQLLLASPAVGEQAVWEPVRSYLLDGGEVAGHGINDATVGGEAAALFEFRSIPDSLVGHVPKAKEDAPAVTDPLAELKDRAAGLKLINDFVNEKREAFAGWYRTTFKKPDIKTPWTVAAAAQKATWIRQNHGAKWTEIVEAKKS